MKANKRFITALLAVLTIFVLVPTMAFAATPAGNDAAKWTSDYSKVSITKGSKTIEYNADRVFDPETGVITATASDADKSESQKFGGSDGIAPEVAQFYDLDGAVLCDGTGAEFKVRSYTRDDFETAFARGEDEEYAYDGQWTLKLKKPAYDTTSPATVKDTGNGVAVANYDIVFDPWAQFDPNSDEAQTLEVPITIAPADGVVIGEEGVLECLNGDKLGTITLTVSKKEYSAADAVFYTDTVSEFNKIEGTAAHFLYNGAAHTIVMGDLEGYSVAYSVYNAGKYEPVDAVSITDVSTKAMKVKAVVTNTAKATDTQTFNFDVYVDPINAPYFSFEEDGDAGSYQYAIEGAEYDPMTYISVIPYEYGTSKYNNASKAAVEANKTLLMEYFKDYYEINAKATKLNPDTIDLTIGVKDLSAQTAAEQKAMTEKYKQLLANFGADYIDYDNEPATLFINASFITPEIQFTNTPTAVKYKAKKLKKKDASFTVTATCNTGAAVSYKLIDAPEKITIDQTSGMITLAKGLKKGTYKIKVKAYLTTPFYNPLVSPTEVHAIKIKVKK